MSITVCHLANTFPLDHNPVPVLEDPDEFHMLQCSLLLRILKVYRKRSHSGYIQYTYRGFPLNLH